MLRRYWFTFERFENPTALNLGCGVTAASYDDALALVRDSVFHGRTPPINDCIEDVDVSRLDANHVLPNVGNVLVHGIWFPLGYK
jgi:hypothetical protein